MARAWPISFWAIEEKATSSSSSGAIPVYSESRQPRTSSSSARPSSACSLTCLLQSGLDGVAVDAAVLEAELVGPVLDVADRVARDEPERDRLAAPAVLLAGPRFCEVRVGSDYRARVLEGGSALLLAEDLPDRMLVHAARTASRTHCSWSRKRRRRASRSAVFGPAQLRVWHRESQLPDLWHVAVEELLPRLAVPLRLDPPQVHRVLVGWDRVAVEMHQRAPPAVQRLLHELELLGRARDHGEDDVAAVEDVERLLPADLLHDPRVRRVRALEQRLLADDRRRVDEPRDHADVAPCLRRVVEDVVELRLAADEIVEALLARFAEVLDDAVDQLRVTDLVLHLRRQRELALKRRRAQDPFAFG